MRGDFELLCPGSVSLQHPTLIAALLPNAYMQLQCNTVMKDWEELRLISGLELGPVNSFALRLCPLPGISFKELMATVGIPSTKSLIVQSHGNMSNTLTRRHLEGLHELTQLNLNMNALSELPQDLFSDLGNLTWLDLKNNNVILPKGIFKPLPKLDVLELGGNNITFLEPGIFRNLTKLRLLNLWGNKLQNLTRSVFSDVPNLENLDLSSNKLVTLPPDVFADLIKLKNINLYTNDFISLPQSLFRSTPLLEKVQIHSNLRALKTLPSGLFANLKHLKELNLKNCNISSLPQDLLAGCYSIENLTLQQNLLEELPQDLFKDIKDVTMINLSKNKLINLPETIFSTLTKLKILDLSHNKLQHITKDLFSNLRSLEVLKIHHNNIKYIHPQGFDVTANLLTVDLSHNKLSELHKNIEGPFGKDSVLHAAVKLEVLYLAHNRLSTLYADWQISKTNLELIDLSYNNYTHLMFEDLQFTSLKLTIDLSNNNISLISLNTAEALGKNFLEGIKNPVIENHSVKVVLKNNPFVCNCNAYNLIRYFRGELAPEVNLIATFDGTNFTCAEPKELEGLLVMNLDSRMVTCKMEEEKCVSNCTCHYRPSNSALVVDCSEMGLTKVPPSLPVDDSIIKYTNHTELDLRGNRLVSLPDILGTGYSRVTKLYLSYNNLTRVNLTNFNKYLQVVELNNNNLSRMDPGSQQVLEKSKNLETIRLENNPWICDCDAKDFLMFLQRKYQKIPMISNVTCANGVSISSLTVSELCHLTSATIAIISVLVAFLGLLIGGSLALYYRYQKEIKIWLYAHQLCLWFVTEEELDKDKQYDAFVSYSHKDEKFITEHLQPMLEKGEPKYKLCLHYRDWLLGEFIPNQIARSVEDSRRTIVVLSPNFLESVWGRMEFRTAHSQALSEGRARVIVILYGDIGPTDDLDPELKAYLSMNTYVKWGDPWFWKKLRYALPHPPPTSKGIPLFSRQSTRRNGTEKLMNGSDPNSTPPAVNTPPADALIIEPLKTLSNSKPV